MRGSCSKTASVAAVRYVNISEPSDCASSEPCACILRQITSERLILQAWHDSPTQAFRSGHVLPSIRRSGQRQMRMALARTYIVPVPSALVKVIHLVELQRPFLVAGAAIARRELLLDQPLDEGFGQVGVLRHGAVAKAVICWSHVSCRVDALETETDDDWAGICWRVAQGKDCASVRGGGGIRREEHTRLMKE